MTYEILPPIFQFWKGDIYFIVIIYIWKPKITVMNKMLVY
jgi:hypothetical protein